MATDRSDDPFAEIEFRTLSDDADPEFAPGSTEDQAIDGGGGNDVIVTGAGRDAVRGGAGNDYINTGAGDDVLSGGGGSNILAGGTGADTFVIDAGDLTEAAPQTTTITDFNPAEDCLRLIGFDFASVDEIPSYVSGSGIFLQLAPGKTLLLQRLTPTWPTLPMCRPQEAKAPRALGLSIRCRMRGLGKMP